MLAALLVPLSQSACILCSEDFPEGCMQVFNSCEEERGALLGHTLVELDVRKSVVRTREALIGNLVADALYDTAAGVWQRNGLPGPPDAAVQNGGGIRSQTACGERELIPAGPLYEGDVNQILPFGNALVMVEMTGLDLKLAIEHSVDELALPGKAGESGHFLQVSRLRFEVDCAQAAHALDANATQIITSGSRIVDSSLEIRTDDGSGAAQWAAVDVSRASSYSIAMPGFIGGGNDGFLAWVLRDASEVAQVDSEGNYLDRIQLNGNGEKKLRDASDQVLTDADALAAYILNSERVAPQTGNRIILRPNCVAGYSE